MPYFSTRRWDGEYCFRHDTQVISHKHRSKIQGLDRLNSKINVKEAKNRKLGISKCYTIPFKEPLSCQIIIIIFINLSIFSIIIISYFQHFWVISLQNSPLYTIHPWILLLLKIQSCHPLCTLSSWKYKIYCSQDLHRSLEVLETQFYEIQIILEQSDRKYFHILTTHLN